jgi:hypothetical protein
MAIFRQQSNRSLCKEIRLNIRPAMLNRSFQEMGIPPGYGLKELLFSPVANALVVQMQPSGGNWRPERLYFRHTTSDKYRPIIGEPDHLTSQEFPFVQPTKPLLAYNSMQHRFFPRQSAHPLTVG